MTNIKKKWRPIPNFEGLYEVSNTGDVMCLNYMKKGVRGLMAQTLINSGYFTVSLTRNGKATKKLVHRLVAETFIPNPNNYPCVNHKDCCKTNNNVDNLEFCTYSYNNTYAEHRKKQSESHINNLENNKLAKKVICIETGMVFNSARTAARTFGVCHSGIVRSCNSKSKKCGEYHWKYLIND